MRKAWDVDAWLVAGILLLAMASVVAAGQEEPPPADAPQPGALTIERVKSGFVVTPDVKLTDVDDEFATLAGVQVGWMTDRTLFIGAAGYWLTDGAPDREFAYGGAVVEWALRSDRRLGFGARALVGGGSATLSRPNGGGFTWMDASNAGNPMHRSFRGFPGSAPGWSADGHRTGLLRDDFFVLEPQLNLHFRAADWLRVGAGVGYRVIGTQDAVADRLRGVGASISLQMGGGT